MEEERTTKEQLLQMLSKVQELQRISAGIVQMNVTFRVYEDGDCSISVYYFNVSKKFNPKTASEGSECTYLVYLYENEPYAKNKAILAKMINHIKDNDAL